MKKNILSVAVSAVLIVLYAFSASDWRLPWAVGRSLERGADWCEAHGVKLSECEACNPALARGGTRVTRAREPEEGECPNAGVRVTLAPGAARQVGLELVTVQSREVDERILANAETLYAPSRFARVAGRLPGLVREVAAILGEEVEAGAVLARLESPDLGQAKSDYLQALALLELRQRACEREQALFEQRVAPERQVQEARAALEEARLGLERSKQRLSALGFEREAIQGIAETKDASCHFLVRSPLRGVVVDASAVLGEMAVLERPLFAVADLDRLWIRIDVYECDLAKIEKGQRVTFTVEGLPGRKFPGLVVAVGGQMDDRARTASVYAEVENPGRLLRANMFGRVQVVVSPREPKLLIPAEAVQYDGDCHLVFVSSPPDAFEARQVELGTVYESGYEVTKGIAAGEQVVTTGSFLLKTEVLRGQIGAG